MFGRGPFGLVVGIVLVLAIVAGAGAVGYLAYNAGVANGLAQAGSSGAPAAGEPAAVGPYLYAPYVFRPFWSGFGPFGCLVPLLFFLLLFGAMRMLLWPRGWGWAHRGMGRFGHHGDQEWPKWMQERAEEWHRRMHGEVPEPPAESES